MTAASVPEVRPVADRRALSAFLNLPRTLYRSDPAYVRPLRWMQRFQIDAERNPFYRHAERALWVAWRGGQPVGRIAAIVDRLYEARYRDGVGFFGFFETVDDVEVASSLLATAQAWLAERGCRALRGPVNPSMKGEFGVLVEGNAFPPFVMMAHSHAYLDRLIRGCGFHIARTFCAFFTSEDADWLPYRERWSDYDRLCQRVRQRHPEITIRQANRGALEHDIRRINELGDRVRSDSWGFVPFTPEEIEHSVKQLRRILRPEQVLIAEIGTRVIGYIMAMRDLNDALRRTRGPWDGLRMAQLPWQLARTRRVRIFGLGVDPEFRPAGVAGQLIHRLYAESGLDYPGWELSWVDTENLRSIRAIQRFIPLQAYKTYRLYEKPIADRAPPPAGAAAC